MTSARACPFEPRHTPMPPSAALHILDRISQVLVKGGSGNIVAETDLNYEKHDCACFRERSSGSRRLKFRHQQYHPRQPYFNHHVHQRTAHSGSNTRNMSTNTVGNLRAADLSCCNKKTWAFSSATQYAFPDSVTNGSSTPTLTTSRHIMRTPTCRTSSPTRMARRSRTPYDSVNRLTKVTRNADA